ncbi:hypothetical protein DSBG_3209 [Desulfosporosinus sp. BG]|nr:hypothetical protein DSBG_3209 [Desulfosporosinus sp. BG]
MITYLLLFSLIIMWYPFYLKYKNPKKYKGFWKIVGEWLGEPRDAFQ